MTRLRTLLPHLITLLALTLLGVTLAFYASSRSTYVRMSEAGYLTRTWDREILDLTFADATDTLSAPLPCPALIERTTQGRYDTYVATARVTRANPHPSTGEPVASCGESPYYLIHLEVGWGRHPDALSKTLVNDTVAALQNPQLLMRSHVRTEQQPLTITALEERP